MFSINLKIVFLLIIFVVSYINSTKPSKGKNLHTHQKSKTSEDVQAIAAHKVISRLISQNAKYIKINVNFNLPDNSYQVC